jgi:hypothetical protein
MIRPWRVELIETAEDAVLARYYYDRGLAVKFKSPEARGTVAVYAGRLFVVARSSAPRRETIIAASLAPSDLLRFALILMRIRSQCDFANLLDALRRTGFCAVSGTSRYLLCSEEPVVWSPCL